MAAKDNVRHVRNQDHYGVWTAAPSPHSGLQPTACSVRWFLASAASDSQYARDVRAPLRQTLRRCFDLFKVDAFVHGHTL
jgi:hypothetical protein